MGTSVISLCWIYIWDNGRRAPVCVRALELIFMQFQQFTVVVFKSARATRVCMRCLTELSSLQNAAVREKVVLRAMPAMGVTSP
jgi:hypothetical protein